MKKVNYIQFIEEIGSGGTANVWLGVDTHSGYPVAIKVLHKSLFKNEMIKQKFREEANRYVYLSHPNIVRLEDYIEKEDAFYLIMEYVEGDNLEDYINKISGPIPEEIGSAMMKEILSAIEYAHHQKVVHLDIKPSNIMITKDGDIKILDFGISADLNEEISDKRMGTPMYMSPEQINGINVNHKTDIWALGITYHQMLTAQLPFPKEINRDQLFSIIRSKPLKRIKDFIPWGSIKSQQIIDKATTKNPYHRYSSCKEFYNDINSL